MTKDNFLLFDQAKSDENVSNRAKAIKELIDDKGMRVKEIAQKLGLKESHICHLLRLNRLPSIVVDSYSSEQLTASHLFMISRLKNPDDIMTVYEKILSESLTVAKTEEIVREYLYKIKSDGVHIPHDEVETIKKKTIGESRDISVKVVQTRIRGRLAIEIKGDLVVTTNYLRQLFKKLTADEKSEPQISQIDTPP